ncbi:hypothetical protein MAPG_06186 [Magnaporthiopsis poae ATCC 64411]|uniref:Uncharacterized protein n=1 Tax=Magnaporthiopsis poae (strain ATCC 64411 / 73-15) TaxID=644358 RepID=A0A0C4E1C9_MAGP6|nr:hypothetical protein MAPG_06186 [Magnaporthiopsis poae ATCC 64411]
MLIPHGKLYHPLNVAPSATTSQGTIRKARGANGNSVFISIHPPCRNFGRRQQMARPAARGCVSGTLNGAAYGPICPQAESPSGGQWSRQDEDCLNLNIQAPEKASHPGGHIANKSFIYVNFNTRESIFASLHSSEPEGASPEESQTLASWMWTRHSSGCEKISSCRGVTGILRVRPFRYRCTGSTARRKISKWNGTEACAYRMGVIPPAVDKSEACKKLAMTPRPGQTRNSTISPDIGRRCSVGTASRVWGCD